MSQGHENHIITYQLFNFVNSLGGLQKVVASGNWAKAVTSVVYNASEAEITSLLAAYKTNLLSLEASHVRPHTTLA